MRAGRSGGRTSERATTVGICPPCVKCQNGVISGRLVSVVARSGREFSHVEPAEHQIVHPVSASGLPLQAAAARRGAHTPSARQHPPHAHEKHRFGAIPFRSSGQLLFFIRSFVESNEIDFTPVPRSPSIICAISRMLPSPAF